MGDDVQRMLDVLDDLRRDANADACFGEPVQIEGRTVIPVARVSYGFGVAGGDSYPSMTTGEEGVAADTEARGRGIGGMRSYPLGVIEVTSDGIRLQPIVDTQRVAVVSLVVGAWSLFWLVRALRLVLGRRG